MSIRRILKSESFRILVVFTLLALISGTLLGVTYVLTRVDEDARLREALGNSYTSPLTDTVLDTTGFENRDWSVIKSAYVAQDGAVLILSKATRAYNSAEGVDMIVIIKEGEIVGLSVYRHAETPGLGTMAFADGYLNRFIGLSVDDFDLTKNSGGATDVGTITTATRSSNAVIFAVEGAVAFYMFINGEGQNEA